MRLSVVLLCCALLSPVFVAADIESVTVTGQKRSENVLDVPLALQVFAGDDLIAAGVEGTQALQHLTPGLVISNTGNTAQIFLRGVGTRLALAGIDPSVALYLDDQYIGISQAGLFELSDIERVEVLKGPLGTLYGRNATGGAVRILTRDVDDMFSASGRVVVGNYNARRVAGNVNAPLTDAVGLRASVLVDQRDGYAENIADTGLDELDDADLAVLRVKTAMQLTDAVKVVVNAGVSEQDDTRGFDNVVLGKAQYSVGIATGGRTARADGKVASSITDTTETDSRHISLRVEVDGDAAQFIAITSYWDFDTNGPLDLDGTDNRALDFSGIPANTDSLTQEFQWLSTSQGDWEWLAGVYFYTQDTRFEGLVDRRDAAAQGIPGPPQFSLGDQSVETDAYAVYGRAGYQIDPSWSVVVGGRYSYEEKQLDLRPSSRRAITVTPPLRDTGHWGEFTPEVIAQYDYAHGMAYARYARGFKSGGFNYPGNQRNPISGDIEPALSPELLDMFELGWKSLLLQRRLQLAASLYFYDYRDLQVTANVTDDNGTQSVITRNAATARATGVDASLTFAMSAHWSLDVALNAINAEYREFQASAQLYNAVISGDDAAAGMSAVPFDASGENLLRTPALSGYVGLQYQAALAQGQINAGLSYSYTSEYDFDFVVHPSMQALQQSAYGLFSARVGYSPDDGRWTVSLWGKNLADEAYFDDVNANGAGIRGSYASPRTYGLELAFDL